MEYLLLGLILLFAMRIVFKRTGGHGLIAPILIIIVSGAFLLVGTTKVVVLVSVVVVLFALLMRTLIKSDTSLA